MEMDLEEGAARTEQPAVSALWIRALIQATKTIMCIHTASCALPCSQDSMACSTMQVDWHANCTWASGRGGESTSCG